MASVAKPAVRRAFVDSGEINHLHASAFLHFYSPDRVDRCLANPIFKTALEDLKLIAIKGPFNCVKILDIPNEHIAGKVYRFVKKTFDVEKWWWPPQDKVDLQRSPKSTVNHFQVAPHSVELFFSNLNEMDRYFENHAFHSAMGSLKVSVRLNLKDNGLEVQILHHRDDEPDVAAFTDTRNALCQRVKESFLDPQKNSVQLSFPELSLSVVESHQIHQEGRPYVEFRLFSQEAARLILSNQVIQTRLRNKGWECASSLEDGRTLHFFSDKLKIDPTLSELVVIIFSRDHEVIECERQQKLAEVQKQAEEEKRHAEHIKHLREITKDF